MTPAPEDVPGADLAAAPEQLTSKLGIEITRWDADRLVGTMPVKGNRQPYGLLHGGANAALAETLGSVAAAMHAAPERLAVGLELSCTHHRAVTEGVVTGVCTPIHRGRSTATYEIVITDEQDRRACTARLTCFLKEAPAKDQPKV
ncbi:hotdog fold thioesterase [Saccharothrix sp. 6-C]|uniref:hotdog fold thioesterase n=1 Tax=Saccharothrix sp. 6-C TaxID=2781735 RepID=UPI0019175CD7|nr:hotdog fold thioesterase [Saccharothrix sp. 6-C]QQQ74858.1 hotdog fold thioesterase [Saccharothrix sp. 6-C]